MIYLFKYLDIILVHIILNKLGRRINEDACFNSMDKSIS
jgi:hypothetical protein